MPSISATGIDSGSGLDVNGLVSKLVGAERAPVDNRLNRQEAQIQANISALGTFRGALADFQESLKTLRDSTDLHKVSTNSSDEDILAVTATNGAQQGNYQIEVSQLAQAHRLTSETFLSDIEPIGTGNLSFQFGRVDPATNRFDLNKDASVKNIQITDNNSSLRGIKESVNQAGMGVRATIVNDGQGFRLVFTAEGTGEINSLRVLINDDGDAADKTGLSRLGYDPIRLDGKGMHLIETARAQDARINIDGIEVISSSNKIDGAIEGLLLNIKNLTSNEPVQVKADFDLDAVIESVRGFVNSYNAMNDVIKSVAGYDPATKQAGPLAGDPTIRGVTEQIRRLMGVSFAEINEEYVSLASLGVDTQNNGNLLLDENKLRDAIESNLLEVEQVFAKAGSASDTLVKFISAQNETKMGAYPLRITQLATHGYYIGDESGNLRNRDIAEGSNQLVIKVDGVTSSPVTLPAGKYSDGRQLAVELERQINNDEALKREKVSVSVKFVVDQFVIQSARLGEQSRAEIISADPAIRALGLDPATGIDGIDIQGTMGGLPADGSGNRLTGRGTAAGLQVEVLGGKAGARGDVFFSRGVAEQLNGILDGFLSKEGILTTRDKGYNTRINDIGKQREQLERRLAVSEQQLLHKFSSLDGLLGKMRSTSDFLSSHLTNLPGARSSGSGNRGS